MRGYEIASLSWRIVALMLWIFDDASTSPLHAGNTTTLQLFAVSFALPSNHHQPCKQTLTRDFPADYCWCPFLSCFFAWPQSMGFRCKSAPELGTITYFAYPVGHCYLESGADGGVRVETGQKESSQLRVVAHLTASLRFPPVMRTIFLWWYAGLRHIINSTDLQKLVRSFRRRE